MTTLAVSILVHGRSRRGHYAKMSESQTKAGNQRKFENLKKNLNLKKFENLKI